MHLNPCMHLIPSMRHPHTDDSQVDDSPARRSGSMRDCSIPIPFNLDPGLPFVASTPLLAMVGSTDADRREDRFQLDGPRDIGVAATNCDGLYRYLLG